VQFFLISTHKKPQSTVTQSLANQTSFTNMIVPIVLIDQNHQTPKHLVTVTLSAFLMTNVSFKTDFISYIRDVQ
jgi:hypothetical protein